MLHIQFDLIDATIPRQLGNDEMFSMKIKGRGVVIRHRTIKVLRGQSAFDTF
jgi:hypothetical protein